MKKIYSLLAILATLLCSSKAFSQNVLLQDTTTWDAKCFYASVGGESPDPKWYEESFPDSIWDTITGPIYRSTWPTGSTYWLRRHFVVNDIAQCRDGYLHLLYDCDGIAYLNGQKIHQWSGYNTSWVNIDLSRSIMDLIHEGDNVLAMCVTDNYGDTFINFGLYGWNEPRKYKELHNAVDSLQRILNEGPSNALSLTISEAISLIEKAQTAMTNYEYTNSDAEEMTRIINSMIDRLAYQSINIAVTVPGSLGDSILSKVENFSDVVSIKVSGKLNDTDLSTIQSRLTNLREIDMTNVTMENFPNQFFYQHHNLQKVFLPKSLVSIGEYAFYQCYSIYHIEFPATLTTINRYGFSECDNLQEVILPEGFNSMGEFAFYSCDNNKRVKLPGTLKSISTCAFYYNVNLRNIEFTEGLTHIYNEAFFHCQTLNNLKFPATLYYIGGHAFAYNSSLSNIEFNEGLYQISDNAFCDCDALTEVTLPSSLVLANPSPFDYCDNLMKVTCLSIEPPYMTDQIPYGLSMNGRELHVPALSINAYKQTSGWDKFQTIKPIEYLPENLTVLGNLKLTLPKTIPADYKPDVSLIHDQKGTSYWQYGSLTVNGEGTLSMSNFSLLWDPNCQFVQYNRTQNDCSLINNSHLRADNIHIDIYARNDRWTFISFPFDVKVSDIETSTEGTTNWVVRKYDGQKRAEGKTSETWIKLDQEDIMKAGEGYILQGSRYIGTNWQEGSSYTMKAINNVEKNNIFRTSDVTVTLNEYGSEFAHNRSWNLIGNPYPCYYDTRFMNFEAPITVWNMRNNTYEAYSPVDDSYILRPGEAFFVQRPVSNGNIVFGKDGRQINRDVRTIEAPARTKAHENSAANVHRSIVNLSLSDEKNTDRTRIVLNNNATLQYEMDKDASKFMSTDAAVPQIFTSTEGVNYAINERPFADGEIFLCTYIGTEGLYTITLINDIEGYNVVLEDKTENKNIVLTSESSYTFFAEAGTYTGRFVLHIIDKEATDIENIQSDADNADIYSIEGIKVTCPTQRGVYIQNGKKILLNK